MRIPLTDFRLRRLASVTATGLALLAVTAGSAVAVPERAGRPVARVVPAGELAALRDAATACPALTPARLAGQVMATSLTTGRDAALVDDAAWRRWAPAPGTDRADPRAALGALARQMCDLIGRLRAVPMEGDLWRPALAAYRVGVSAVARLRSVPAAAEEYVAASVAYADDYARQPEFAVAPVLAAAPAPPRVSPSPAAPKPPAPPAAPSPGRSPGKSPAAPPRTAATSTPATGKPTTRATTAKPRTVNLALHHTAYATTEENGDRRAGYAFDGDRSTRWSSVFGDAQWLYVDLGATRTVTSVTLRWEDAYASQYMLETSNDANTWARVHENYHGDGGVDRIGLPSVRTRYMKIWLPWRGTEYGFSLWEFEVYGT